MNTLKIKEQEFFKTFDIRDAKCKYHGMHCNNYNCSRFDDHCEDAESFCKSAEFDYRESPITDSEYIKLIELLIDYATPFNGMTYILDLKRETLETLIRANEVNKAGDIYKCVKEIMKPNLDEEYEI